MLKIVTVLALVLTLGVSDGLAQGPAPTSPAPTSPAPTSPAPTSPAPTSPATATTPTGNGAVATLPGGISIRVDNAGTNSGAGTNPWGAALNVILLLTVLTLTPAILVSVTCFTRVIITLHFLRQAIGTQSAPGNQVLVGLALFITFFTMQPVGQRIYDTAAQPLLAGEMDGPRALGLAWTPLREFMLPLTRNKDFALFQDLAGLPPTDDPAAVSARVLIPAFIVSEVKTAFQIGILLYIPFLMLDLLVSSVLLALGMMQLPPIVISTPLKLILFVVVDGWNILIGSLVRSIVG